MSAIPKAIQAQVEEADRLVEEINKAQEPEEVKVSEPEVIQKTSEVKVPEPESKPTQSEEVVEQKYRTLKGKYDAEVPRLSAQLKDTQNLVDTLEREKAELAEKLKQQELQKTVPQITDEDREAFGTDLVDLIERAANAKVAPLVDENAQLKAQLKSLTERQGFSDKDRYLMGLDAKFPEWREMNSDPAFLAWLDEIDPVYGVSKFVALQNAESQLDIDRTISIFKTYKQTQTPAQKKISPKDELARQVAPNKAGSSSAYEDKTDNQKIWTQQEIARIYEDARRNRLTDEEFAKAEREIHTAVAEGRVR